MKDPELPTRPVAMVLTRFWTRAGPFLSLRVTAPSAPDQVTLKGWPAGRVPNIGLVNSTALATTTRTEARRSFANCIFADVIRGTREKNGNETWRMRIPAGGSG